MLYDLLRDARKGASALVPPPLRREFTEVILSDRVLAGSAIHLLSGFQPPHQPSSGEPDLWLHNEYVANYLRGVLLLGGLDERIRLHRGDPEEIAQVMVERVANVAFWAPRHN
jgi:hypothetical protein